MRALEALGSRRTPGPKSHRDFHSLNTGSREGEQKPRRLSRCRFTVSYHRSSCQGATPKHNRTDLPFPAFSESIWLHITQAAGNSSKFALFPPLSSTSPFLRTAYKRGEGLTI